MTAASFSSASGFSGTQLSTRGGRVLQLHIRCCGAGSRGNAPTDPRRQANDPRLQRNARRRTRRSTPGFA